MTNAAAKGGKVFLIYEYVKCPVLYVFLILITVPAMEMALLESQLATSLLRLSKPLMENSYVILHKLWTTTIYTILQQLVQQFAAGAPITVSFPQVGGSTNFPDPNGCLISSFTRQVAYLFM